MCTCANCQWKARWEIHYQKYLKDNPGESSEEFIARMRETDEILVCLRPQIMTVACKNCYGEGLARELINGLCPDCFKAIEGARHNQ